LFDRIFTPKPVGPSKGLWKRFGDLKVRPKLILLHNLFFLVLTCSVYFNLLPPFERRVARAKTIEVSLVTEIFSSDRPLQSLPKIETYDYREGSAEQLQVSPEIQEWLNDHRGEVWQNSAQSDYMFKRDPRSGLYRRITLPNLVYDTVLERAKWSLFLVLGIIYVLAVLLLEQIIMPRYVYQPLRLMLNADRATQRGDRHQEIIDDQFIPGDEIGQIMRSRNTSIAELRKQEDDLAQALARLEAQDRLASLGLLSASVAHELNTPLAVLRGSIEKLAETVPEPHAQERLARMLRVTQRLQKISEGLVDFARVRNQEVVNVPIRPLVQEAWSLVAIDEKASAVHFTNETADDDMVIGNPDRLIQVFVNLLRNALNAVESNGSIYVRCRKFTGDGKQWIAISVDDDGPGIAAGVLPDIFEAFVSTRLDAQGTGLGLTVAEGIVQQHGGTISASNRPGGGARLEVTLRSAA
jgi:signal transduction histidine kinase